MQISQSLLVRGAVIVLFLTSVFWVWKGMLDGLSAEADEVRRGIDRVRKQFSDTDAKRRAEQSAYDAKKTAWLARHQEDLAKESTVGTDWKALAEEAKADTERLRGRIAAAKTALSVDKTEIQLKSELRREINRLAEKLVPAEADRKRLNINTAPNRATGYLELTVEFQFVVTRAAWVALLRDELDAALPYMALDTLTLTPANDKETDPEKKRFELTGKLIGYVYPAGSLPT
jgi:hypothetical protein